jgi:hypothetical protein
MAPGDLFIVSLTMRATAPGPITNTATATSATDDPVPENNSASVGTLIVADGCSPGFWKTHPDAWASTGYAPGQTVGSTFSNSGRAATTLSAALGLPGGNGVQGAKDILLRAAVAALLNAAHPGVFYPLTTASVISQVNAALASNHRATILALAKQLDGYNNLACPLG